MALLCRIRQSTPKNISNQFRRWYFQVPGGFSERTKPLLIEIPSRVDQRRSPPDFRYSNVRFLSSRVKKPFKKSVQKKEKEVEIDETRLNEKITAEFIRLVSDEGHVILSKREALERARELNLDLVEVQRNGNPPVCKIMDYNREKFAKETKDKVRVKETKTKDTLKTGVCKEVRFPMFAEQKDLQMKADLAKKLMENGFRVMCSVYIDKNKVKKNQRKASSGEGADISRVTNLIGEFSVIESVSKGEKQFVIARHVKFGPVKKGMKDSKGDLVTSELPDDDLDKQNPTWTVNADDGELNGVFDIEDEETVPIHSSGPKDNIKTRPHLPGQRTGASTPAAAANDVSKPKLPYPSNAPPSSSSSSSSTSYGIFSRPAKVNGDSSGAIPAEDNRYKKGKSSGSTRPGTTTSPNNQGPRGSGGKWGIFDGEGSNLNPNPNPNRANVQR